MPSGAQRPRDAAGRPLPYGAVGVDPVPERSWTPDEGLAEADRLLAAGRPFAAHEVLEAVWKAADPPQRLLWRSLAQLAVGLTHLQRGNLVGGRRLLRRGAEGLRPWEHRRPYGLDVSAIIQAAYAAADGGDPGAWRDWRFARFRRSAPS